MTIIFQPFVEGLETGLWCPACSLPSVVASKISIWLFDMEGVSQVGETHHIACESCGLSELAPTPGVD